jgi:hypothetical protein
MLLLLGRHEEFTLSGALTVLDKMVKYYPRKDEHVGVIDARLKEITRPDGGSIGTKVKRYKANRKLAITGRKPTETAEPLVPVTMPVSVQNLHFPPDVERRPVVVPRSPSRLVQQCQMTYGRLYDDRSAWAYAYQAYQYPSQAQIYEAARPSRRPQ